MITTTYNAVSIYLLNDQPDWRGAVTLDVDVIADLTKSLSNREGRRAYASTLRVSNFSYSSTVFDAAARELVASLRNYQTQPVAVPFWPAAVNWSDRASRPIAAGLNIAYKDDWSQWEIYESSDPVWPAADDHVAPLLYGRLEKRELKYADSTSVMFDVSFVEASPAAWAILPAAVTWGVGPAPSGAYASNPKLFPFHVDFGQPTQDFQVSIIRNQLGFTREPLETLYAQTNARGQAAGHTLTTAVDIGQALRFFLDHGAGATFWTPQVTPTAQLTADVGVSDTVLHVADTDSIQVGDWLAFTTTDGLAATARVLAATATTVTVDSATGTLSAASTMICQLVLCRFEKTRLSMAWTAPDIAQCSIGLREVPPEYTIAGDEVLGTSLGVLPKRCLIYEFRTTLNGVDCVARYTSFESGLNLAGNNCQSAKVSHSDIKQSLNLDQDEVSVTMPVIVATEALAPEGDAILGGDGDAILDASGQPILQA